MDMATGELVANRLAEIVLDCLPLRILAVVLLVSGLLFWLAWQWVANEWEARFRRRSECPACHGAGDVGGNAIGCHYCGGEG